MGKYPVTQAQYRQVLKTNPSANKGGNDFPVEQVPWDSAQKFCASASTLSKLRVQLPTEAEWEFACRAGTGTSCYSGDDIKTDLGDIAWSSENSKGATHPVGQKKPNAFDLYDMVGNVPQWCRGWYYYSKLSMIDPVGNADSYYRILRGGGADTAAFFCRSASRRWANPDERGIFGLRIVVPVNDSSKEN